MIVQQRITAEAEQAAQRYGVLVESWRGLYQRAIYDSRFGTARLLNVIRQEAYNIGQVFLETERLLVAAAFETIASEARTATLQSLGVDDARELVDAADEQRDAIASYLLHELTIQIERDIAFLIDALRRTFLQVATAARSQRRPLKSALAEFTIGNASELHFFFHDRRNQKWPSRKFVRAVWRINLLSAYNEIVLLVLADHGVDHAMVEHLDPNSQFHQMLVALYSGSQHPTYAEIRNEIFHPNSDAILAPVRTEDVPA